MLPKQIVKLTGHIILKKSLGKVGVGVLKEAVVEVPVIQPLYDTADCLISLAKPTGIDISYVAFIFVEHTYGCPF